MGLNGRKYQAWLSIHGIPGEQVLVLGTWWNIRKISRGLGCSLTLLLRACRPILAYSCIQMHYLNKSRHKMRRYHKFNQSRIQKRTGEVREIGEICRCVDLDFWSTIVCRYAACVPLLVLFWSILICRNLCLLCITLYYFVPVLCLPYELLAGCLELGELRSGILQCSRFRLRMSSVVWDKSKHGQKAQSEWVCHL